MKLVIPLHFISLKTQFLILALIIFGKMHFLLISENNFFHEIKRDGITSMHGIHVIVFLIINIVKSQMLLFIYAVHC